MTLGPRLLIVTPTAFTLGGVPFWLDYLQPGLAARAWDVTIGLVEGPRTCRPAHYLAAHPHPQWVAVPCQTRTIEGRTRAILRAIQKVQPDLVLAVNIPDVYLAVGRLRDRTSSRVKTAMALHGIQADLCGDIAMFRDVLDGVIGTNRLACRLATSAAGMPEHRVYYAPCGVVEHSGMRRRDPSDILRIAYVGRLEQTQKRIDDLPAILAQLERSGQPWELRIAGGGPQEDALRDRLAACVPSQRVHFLGTLSQQQLLQEVYPQSDVLLLTSLWETGPIVVWEAFAHGLAVVSSQYIGSGLEAALMPEKTALLFPVGDTQQAAEHLVRLAQNADLCRLLRDNGYQLFCERYSQVSSIQQWDTALRSILAARSLPPVRVWPVARGRSRLDRWLGTAMGETIRELFAVRSPASDCPGSEWPHTYAGSNPGNSSFWMMAAQEDRVPLGTFPEAANTVSSQALSRNFAC